MAKAISLRFLIKQTSLKVHRLLLQNQVHLLRLDPLRALKGSFLDFLSVQQPEQPLLPLELLKLFMQPIEAKI